MANFSAASPTFRREPGGSWGETMDIQAKILIADDEEHIGYLVRFQLEKSGYDVV